MSGERTDHRHACQTSWRLAFVAALGALGLLLSPGISWAQNSSEAKPEQAAKFQPVVVDSVKIEGGAELTAEERASIHESLSGETAHPDWLDRLNAEAARQLRGYGFADGAATGRMESTSHRSGKAHVNVLLTLTSGPRYAIQQVWWAGSSVFTPAQLDTIGVLRVGDVFRPSALSESIRLIVQAYGERGYQAAGVTPAFQKYSEVRKVEIFMEIQEGQKSGDTRPVECKQYSSDDIQQTPYAPSLAYEPSRDGQLQLARAELEARRTHKNVLLIAGFTSCGWCRLLDQTFQRNPATTALRDKNFVVVHLDVSAEGGSGCALNPYPKAAGFPFVYVLDDAGTLLATEEPKHWESSDGYDPQRIEKFLAKWRTAATP